MYGANYTSRAQNVYQNLIKDKEEIENKVPGREFTLSVRDTEKKKKLEQQIKDKVWIKNKEKIEKLKKDEIDKRKSEVNIVARKYNKLIPEYKKASENMKKVDGFVFGTRQPNQPYGQVDSRVSIQNPFAYKKEKMSAYDKKRKPLFSIKYKDPTQLKVYKM